MKTKGEFDIYKTRLFTALTFYYPAKIIPGFDLNDANEVRSREYFKSFFGERRIKATKEPVWDNKCAKPII